MARSGRNVRQRPNFILLAMWYQSDRGICASVALYMATQALLSLDHDAMRLYEGWPGGVEADDGMVEVDTIFAMLVFFQLIGGPRNPGEIGLFYATEDLHFGDDGEPIDNPSAHQGPVHTIGANEAVYHVFLLTPQTDGGAEERLRFATAISGLDYGFLRLHVTKGTEEEPHFLAVLRRNNSYFINTGVVGSPWYRCRSLAELFFTQVGRDTLLARLNTFYNNVRFGDYIHSEPSFWFPKIYRKPSNDWSDVAAEARTVNFPLVTPAGNMPQNAERAVKFDEYEDTEDLGL